MLAEELFRLRNCLGALEQLQKLVVLRRDTKPIGNPENRPAALGV
jgi:hypothetical protein